MSTTLVYVHGTNGSGKSTLARAVLAAAGGATRYDIGPHGAEKAGTTRTPSGVMLMGSYSSGACGGVDKISPYSALHRGLVLHAIFRDAAVMCEGLITPGVDTCKGFAALFDRAVFIHLATPDADAIRNVLKRRAHKGTDKPYDPKNLYKKTASAVSWANRLEAAGLEVMRLEWMGAYRTSLELLGLPLPSVNDLVK